MCDIGVLLSSDLAQGSVPTSSRLPFPRHLDLGEKATAGGEDHRCCGNCAPRAVMGQGLRASALTASVAGFWAFCTLGPRCIALQDDDHQSSSPSTALGQLLNSWCLSFLICKMGRIVLQYIVTVLNETVHVKHSEQCPTYNPKSPSVCCYHLCRC